MGNFFNILIILLFVVGPIINKIYQSMAEKQAMEQERQRRLRETVRAQRARGENPEIAPETRIEAERTAASTRQTDLAARRKAEIEAWRARQAAQRQKQSAQPSPQTQSGWNPSQQGSAPTPTATPAPTSMESEITRRRRAAIEEMRRRRAGTAKPTSTPSRTPQERTRTRRAEPTRPAPTPPPTSTPSAADAIPAEVASSLEPSRRRRVTAAPVTAFAGLGAGRRVAGLTAAQLRDAIILKELLDTPPGLRDLDSQIES